MTSGEYINGYVQRNQGGKYVGELIIDGVNLTGGISGVYFEQEGKKYLWIKRLPIMEYDFDSCEYITRNRKPAFECYLEKQIEKNSFVYKGTFVFLHFKYSILGMWDSVLGHDKKRRLNLYVERLPMEEQTIIKSINQRKKKNDKR